jgi:hypothetical protein
MDQRVCPILKDQCIKDGCRFWIYVDGYEQCIAFWIGDLAASRMDDSYGED